MATAGAAETRLRVLSRMDAEPRILRDNILVEVEVFEGDYFKRSGG